MQWDPSTRYGVDCVDADGVQQFACFDRRADAEIWNADPRRRRCPSPKTASHLSQGLVLAREDTTKQAAPRSYSSETYLGDPRAEQILAKVELPASPIGGRFARLQFDRSYREHAKSLSLLLYPNWD